MSLFRTPECSFLSLRNRVQHKCVRRRREFYFDKGLFLFCFSLSFFLFFGVRELIPAEQLRAHHAHKTRRSSEQSPGKIKFYLKKNTRGAGRHVCAARSRGDATSALFPTCDPDFLLGFFKDLKKKGAHQSIRRAFLVARS